MGRKYSMVEEATGGTGSDMQIDRLQKIKGLIDATTRRSTVAVRSETNAKSK